MKLKATLTAIKDKIISAKGIFNKIKGTHRLVIVDDETLKETFSFRLTGINVFVGVGLSIILLITITTVIIAFTPLREYIPGYTNQEMVDQTYTNAHIIDSLEHVVDNQEALIRNIQAMMIGEVADTVEAIPQPQDSVRISTIIYSHSRADSLLRRQAETQFRFKP